MRELFQTQRDQIRRERPREKHSEVFYQHEPPRLGIIKKGEGVLEQHIIEYIGAKKQVEAIDGDACHHAPEDDPRRFAPHLRGHDPKVQSEVQPHQHERPVRHRQMPLPYHRRRQDTVQKGSGVSAHHHTRQSRTQEGQQKQDIDGQLKHSQRTVPSLKDRRIE